MRYSNDPSQLGAKLGPKMAKLVADTIVDTKRKLLHTDHQVRAMAMQTVIDRAGHEIADLYRPLIREVLKDRDLPPHVAEFVEKTLSGTHQWHAIAGNAFYATGASSVISDMLSNFLAPGVRFAISRDPQLLPSPETIQNMLARGVVSAAWAEPRSSGQGYADDVQSALTEASRSYPDLDTALELLRRGEISHGEAELFLTRNAVPAGIQGALLALQRVHLSPADLADMVVRGIKPQSDAASIAATFGVTADDFNSLVLDTGEPLALMQLLEAFRRGFINQATLQRGIKQSRVRDEWIPVAEQLRYSPMDISDAVRAVVQNQMSEAEAVKIADANGLMPGSVQVLIATEGNPLSRTEVEELYNRGLMTQAEVEQALRESRLKNKYVSAGFALHTRIMTPFEVERALRYQAISTSDATRVLVENGYSAKDAATIAASGTGQRIQTYRDKVVAAAETAYEENLIPRQDAASTIKALGFSDQEVNFILDAAEFRRMARVVNQAVTSVRGRYIARKITRNETSGFLDALGIASQQRDQLIQEWTIGRDANVRTLTEAQIVKAAKTKLITEQDGVARLVQMGYSQGDAELLLAGA